jgi:hypothetical protein
MKKCRLLLIMALALLPMLSACSPSPSGALVRDLPQAMASPEPVEAVGDAQAVGELDSWPGAGAVYLHDETVYGVGEEGPRPMGSLPADAGRLTLGPRGLAYTSGEAIWILGGDGRAAQVRDLSSRVGLDVSLRWSRDGASLAYAAAWNEPDGSRTIELGTYDGAEQRIVGTFTGRPPGPAPTLPPFPPIPPEPGFALLIVLGYDTVDGQLVASLPVGGTEPASLWFHDADTGELMYAFGLPEGTLQAVLSPSTYQLALSAPGEVQIWLLASCAEPQIVTLPPETYAAWLAWSPDGRRVAYLLHEGTSPDLDASPALALEVWETNDDQVSEGGAVRRVGPAINTYAALVGWASADAVLLETFDADGRMRVNRVDVVSGQATPLPLPDGARLLGWIEP